MAADADSTPAGPADQWTALVECEVAMRTMLRVCVLLSVAACSNNSWPPDGNGGVAETKWPAPTRGPWVPAPSARLVQIERHLDCSIRRFGTVARQVDQLGHEEGRLGQIELTLNRAKRELAGRLPEDADRTLTAVDQEVAVLAIVVHADLAESGPCVG